MDYRIFQLPDFELESGIVLPAAQLAYQTYGELNAKRDNAVLLPTFYTGNHERNQGFIGPRRALDPRRYLVISINLFGNGLSSSPSNTAAPFGAANFPRISLFDNVRAQHKLVTEALELEQLALVAGWSMAGCQAFQWAAQYPQFVKAILPFCASAKTSEHNIVFLEGVKAALQADAVYAAGHYREPPVAGLKAFGRVYAGWAFSQSFFRRQIYRRLGFDNAEALLQDWENDHLSWDANDLLCKLDTWQQSDISANPLYQNDFSAALNAIEANCIVIACDNDLYFRAADNRIEIEHIRNGELRIFASAWGHCVASPGNCLEFQQFLDRAITELID